METSGIRCNRQSNAGRELLGRCRSRRQTETGEQLLVALNNPHGALRLVVADDRRRLGLAALATFRWWSRRSAVGEDADAGEWTEVAVKLLQLQLIRPLVDRDSDLESSNNST